jgi:Acyl-coenzyme A synthetases/AMP-(fatty) acid ligases
MLPLAKYRAPGDPVLLAPGGEITATVFFRQVQEMADALPASGFVVNLCETRHGFMLGFAAALLRGQTSLLPPGQGRRDWEVLLRQYPDAYLLSESASLQASGDGDPIFDVSPFTRRTMVAATRGTMALQFPQIDCAHKAAILFTSGSTGQPTAHAKTWGQLCQGAAGLAKALNWAEIPACAVVGSVPPQHMFGLEATVMLPWFTGVPVHAQKPLLPADLEIALRQSARPSWWMTTPLHLRASLRSPTSLAGLAGVVASTMSLPAPLACAAEAAWHVPVLEIYGSTETGALAIRRTAMETHWVPLQGVSLRHEADCESKGEEGRRVWASGAHFESPVLLGDELDIRPDGRFLWIGRSSDLIKVGGKRASLSALNQNLTDIPGVNDGACFFPEDVTSNASDDTHPSRRLAALYVSSTLLPQEVLNALRTRIDPVFLPRPIFRVAQLPRNTNGKLRAASLADLYARCKAKGLPEPRFPAPDGVQHCAVPDAHPSIPGHFPGDPIVPGVVILARVAEAIRTHFPHLELGVLLNVRFHAPLKPGESFCVRPQLQGELVRFEVQLAAPSMDSQSNSGAVIVSGRWAFSTPICNKPSRQ